MSRSKGSQAIKFGRLVEYNIRIIFLKISKKNYGGEASSRPFYENQN